MPYNNAKSNGNERRKEHHQHKRVLHSNPAYRHTGNRHERVGTLRAVRSNRPNHQGGDKGTLQERSFERVRNKAHYPPVRQVQYRGLQP